MERIYETIKFTKEGRVATLCLNRPDVLNAYNIQMRDDLWWALGVINDDPDISSVLLMGEGDRAFCAGADLTEFGTSPSPDIARQSRLARDVWSVLRTLTKPSVAALHGYVIGAGLEMALLCDIRIASTNTICSLPEVRRGISPSAGGSQTLPRVLGQPAALHLMLTGDQIDAQEALRIGLVHQILSGDDVFKAARAWAHHLSGMSPTVFGALKEAINVGMELSLSDGLHLERRLAQQIVAAAADSSGGNLEH